MLSIKFRVFAEVDNFLSDEECAHMIGLAEAEGLEESVTKKHEGSSEEGVKVRDLNGDKRLSIDEVFYLIANYIDCKFYFLLYSIYSP